MIQKFLTVPKEYHNQRVDIILAKLLPEYSRSQITSWIKAGDVISNQQSCNPKDKVQIGDKVEVKHYLQDTSLITPEDIALNLVFEDGEILIINKPAGLVVHPGAGNREHTLVNALLHYEPNLAQLPRAGLVHRLDKDTTGLLIIAKSLTAHNALIQQM